jgi:hypothetical protein
LQALYTKLVHDIEKHIHTEAKVSKKIAGFNISKIMVSVFEKLAENPYQLLQCEAVNKTYNVQIRSDALKELVATPMPLAFLEPEKVPEQILAIVQKQVIQSVAHFMGRPAAVTEEGCNAVALIRGHEHDRLRTFVKRLPKIKDMLTTPHIYGELYALYMRYYGIVDSRGAYWGDIGSMISLPGLALPKELEKIPDSSLQKMITLLYYAAEHFGAYQMQGYWRAKEYANAHPEIRDSYLNGIALFRVHAAGGKGAAG